MNSSELHRLLCQGPPPSRMAETKQKCAAILQEKPVRRRIGFWTFLSQVWRFTGVPMWAAQGMTSILFFLGSSRPRRPHILAAAVGATSCGGVFAGSVCRSALRHG